MTWRKKSYPFVPNEKSFYARMFVFFRCHLNVSFKVNNKIKYNRKSRARLILEKLNRFLYNVKILKLFLKEIVILKP